MEPPPSSTATATAEAPNSTPQERPAYVVWALAWPAVALNSLQVVNNLLDSVFIGSLEVAALTALGGSTNVVFLLFNIAAAVGVASTALVSRAYGAGDRRQFIEANRQCLSLSLVGGLVVALFGSAIAPFAARLFLPASDHRAIVLMGQYLGIYCLGLPAMFIIQSLAGALRGIGDTKSPMVISGIQIVLHIALNLLLIFPTRHVEIPAAVFGRPYELLVPGADLALRGAGMALAGSAWVSAILYALWSSRTPLGRAWGHLLPKWSWVVRIVRIAAPASLMSVVRVTSLMAFMLVLREVPNGSLAIGSIRVSFAIESIAFMPAFGLAIAATTIVGQSLGMKRPDRAERLGWLASHHAGVVSAVVSIPLFIWALPAANLVLPNKPEVALIVAHYLQYVCATEVLFGYGMVLTGAIQGAGDTVRPFWITTLSMWGLRAPLSVFLALASGATFLGMLVPFGFRMGADGCWLSMSITQAVAAIMAMVVFKQGKWKQQKV